MNPPTKNDADDDLLFGLLAYQMNFITREAFLAATSAWRDKSVPLGQILLREGYLRRDVHDLMRILVEKHSAMHGPGLASIAPDAAILRDLAMVPDSDLGRSVEKLSHPGGEADDPYATHYDAPPAALREPGRYRIVRLHARGGLGEVFLTWDDELDREVALKEIQDRYADHPDSRERFVREATITGGLEHPGIVPIYSLGRYPDGRPYYVMRFINGQSLREAIEQFHGRAEDGRDPVGRAMALRRLLRHFVDVCNAVDYAHSRGVIHRDIKPANIMLGQFGETLVVDWGLAKRLDAGPSEARDLAKGRARFETRTGQAIGTPLYMSPEQAAGEIDSLGPASDVFSLGATLHTILSGEAPHAGPDPDRPADRARPAPSPRALDAICAKAMRRRPSERYPSARALADDVELWLADEPTSAYREWAPRRLWRWGRYHPWVGVAVGLATYLIVSVFLSSALLLAPIGLAMGLVGAVAGVIAGTVRGEARQGGRRGAVLGFRIGIGVAIALALAWAIVQIFHINLLKYFA